MPESNFDAQSHEFFGKKQYINALHWSEKVFLKCQTSEILIKKKKFSVFESKRFLGIWSFFVSVRMLPKYAAVYLGQVLEQSTVYMVS